MIEKLKPCPFCGGEAQIIAKPYEPKVCVGCDDDTCLGFSGLGWLYDSEKEAAEAWNSRAGRELRRRETMPTDDERREVARRLRELGLNPWDDAECEIAQCVGIACCNSECHGSDETPECTMALASRLADLIDPPNGLDLDTVQRVCFECMEGCDEPEWTLYATIHDAIARYRRGESGPTCDRDALLRLSDEIYDTSCDNYGELTVDLIDIWGWSQAICEALGVQDA